MDGQNLNETTAASGSITELSRQELAAVHPCVVYRFLLEKSPEACMQLLPLLSDEQFVRLFDYDVWQRDRLSAEAAFRWLDLYRRIDSRELLTRFRSLDEEYQLAIMSPLIELVTFEQLEVLDPRLQDRYLPLPCRQLYYRVKSEKAEMQEAVAAFVEVALTEDLAWTYALLTHANGCLANEQEMLMLQFRTARMEEDGYVSFVESGKIFAPIDLDSCRQRWHDVAATTRPAPPAAAVDWFTQVIAHVNRHALYDDTMLQQVQLKLLFCSNTLCAATLTEASDSRGVRQMLQQTRALIGLALDYLSDSNLTRSATILAAEHSYVLFRVGMTLIYRLQEALLSSLQHRQLPHHDTFVRLYKLRKWAALQDFIDINWLTLIDYEQLEVLKGIFARFPQLFSEDGRFINITSMMHYRVLQGRAQLLAVALEGQ